MQEEERSKLLRKMGARPFDSHETFMHVCVIYCECIFIHLAAAQTLKLDVPKDNEGEIFQTFLVDNLH